MKENYPLIDLEKSEQPPFWVYNNYAYMYYSYLESLKEEPEYEIMGGYERKPELDESLEIELSNNQNLKGIYFIKNESFEWLEQVYYGHIAESEFIHNWINSEYTINCFSAKYEFRESETKGFFDDDEIYNIEVNDYESAGLYPNSQKLDLLVKDYLEKIVPEWGIQYSSKDSIVLDKNRVYHFFEYHFKSYGGSCYDFINHCNKIIQEVWEVASPQNLKRQKYFDEWKTEKIIEYNLDRSKLGLEPVTTPEPPQLQNEETEDLKDGHLWDKLALIHYLNKHKLLKLDTLHQDNTKIANVFSFLIGNSAESIRQKLSRVRKNEFNPSLKNLENILPIVKLLEHKELIEEIETEIKKFS